ncbi:MAG: response regulator transcription factor [Lachnospiraceae bacterium]
MKLSDKMRILIIDDDIELCESLKFLLEHEGFDVALSHDGFDGQIRILENEYDAIILDMMLPILNGSQVLKEIRARKVMTPVIIMSASEERFERNYNCLNSTDKYIKKPFAVETLLKLLRNTQHRQESGNSLLTFKDITLNPNDKVLYCKKGKCTLSERESKLFELFLCSPDMTLSYNTLLAKAWNANQHAIYKDLELYIGFLKRRLRNVESNLTINEVHGKGYRIELSTFP